MSDLERDLWGWSVVSLNDTDLKLLRLMGCNDLSVAVKWKSRSCNDSSEEIFLSLREDIDYECCYFMTWSKGFK
jgi:hypothetical protein